MNKIFEKTSYIDKLDIFYELDSKRLVSHSCVISDDNTYVIIKEYNCNIVWLYIDESATETNLKEIKKKILDIYNEYKYITLVFNPKYEYLFNDLDFIDNKRIRNCYGDFKPVENIEYVGSMRVATMDDFDLLTSMHVNYYKESFNIDMNINFVKIQLSKLIAENSVFVWVNNGQIVTTATMVEYKNRAVMSKVITLLTCRGQGYAKMIIHTLAKLAQTKNKIPLISADKSYPSSNKAYQSIGFKVIGELEELKFVEKD